VGFEGLPVLPDFDNGEMIQTIGFPQDLKAYRAGIFAAVRRELL
jgi:hypothetical protein